MTDYDSQEHKAKSRISTDRKNTVVEEKMHPQLEKAKKPHTTWITKFHQKTHKTTNNSFDMIAFLTDSSLTARVPSLVLAIILYTIMVIVFNSVHPESVANILLYHSYFPILVLFSLASFMLGKAVFISSRRAILLSAFLSLILFLKLQAIELTIVTILIPLLILLGLELIIGLVFRK